MQPFQVQYRSRSPRGVNQQFLTFKLAGEEYGVGILTVQEIRGWSAVTAIPHSPPWVLGVVDLRGVVVPVIDLRRRFELAAAEFRPLHGGDRDPCRTRAARSARWAWSWTRSPRSTTSMSLHTANCRTSAAARQEKWSTDSRTRMARQ